MEGGSTHGNTHQIDTSNMRNLPSTEEELSSQTERLRQVCHHLLSANLLLPWHSVYEVVPSSLQGWGIDCFVPVKHLSGSQRTGANYRDPSKTEQ